MLNSQLRIDFFEYNDIFYIKMTKSLVKPHNMQSNLVSNQICYLQDSLSSLTYKERERRQIVVLSGQLRIDFKYKLFISIHVWNDVT